MDDREWRRWLANELATIKRSMFEMTAATDRISASVASVLAVMASAANDIRNHPAAQDDSGALNALADKLDAAATDLGGAVSADGSAPAQAPAADHSTPDQPAPASNTSAPVDGSAPVSDGSADGSAPAQ